VMLCAGFRHREHNIEGRTNEMGVAMYDVFRHR
jgi:hypothetical protein